MQRIVPLPLCIIDFYVVSAKEVFYISKYSVQFQSLNSNFDVKTLEGVKNQELSWFPRIILESGRLTVYKVSSVTLVLVGIVTIKALFFLETTIR